MKISSLSRVGVSIVLFVSTVGFGLSAGSVSAAYSCTGTGVLCVWSGLNGVADSSGAFGKWYGNSSNWPGVGGYMDGGIENNDSSARNTSISYSVRVYKYQYYGTYLYCVPRGVARNNPVGTADNGSSHTWNRNC